MCSSTDGSRFPVAIAETATLEQLQQQLHRTLGLPPSTFTATVGEAVLQPSIPLTAGVRNASTVTLHPKLAPGMH